jgi:hypothetical protein
MGHRKHKRLSASKAATHVVSEGIPHVRVKPSIALEPADDAGCLKVVALFCLCWIPIAIGILLIKHATGPIYSSRTFVTGIERSDNITTYYYGENRSLTTKNILDVEVGDDIMVDYKEGLFGGIEIVNVREGFL